jgi:hypothetical protein
VDVSALASLDYVVLSHRHADHYDPGLLARLQSFPARWIVPEFMLDSLHFLDLPREKFILAQPEQTLRLGGLVLTPFSGLHWEEDPDYPDARRGVPALGYLAEFNRKRWLLPGDTRTYNSAQVPAFGPVDGIIAHLWLGRGLALQEGYPLLEPFCRFILDMSPSRVVLAHLEEFGRDITEFWDAGHASKVVKRLEELSPGIKAATTFMGDEMDL